MNREWLAFIEGLEQGPYTPQELSVHPQVTPDTYVRKKHWNNWVPIRKVFELKDIFKDKPTPSPDTDNKKNEQTDLSLENATLAMNQPDPFFTFLWWILGFLFFAYLIYIFFYA